MKRPTFIEGIGVAIIASLGGGLMFAVMSTFFAAAIALQLLVVGGSLLYLLYVLARSDARVGKITVLAVWSGATALLWLTDVALWWLLLGELLFIWVVRSIYSYRSMFAALADLGLVAFGGMFAVWSVLQTDSLMVGIWSFFLVQALYVFIPHQFNSQVGNKNTSPQTDRFQHAQRIAEAALSKLSTQN